jgi:hypothetical protein
MLNEGIKMKVKMNYLLFLLYSSISIITALGAFSIVFSVFTQSLELENLIGEAIGSIICGITSFFFIKKTMVVKYRQVMAIRKLITIHKVNDLLSKETFYKVDGLKDVWESERWLKADTQFVPKNFIIGIYDIFNSNAATQTRRNCLVLVNGDYIVCHGDFDADRYVKELRIYQSMLPNIRIMFPYEDLFSKWVNDNKNDLNNRLQNYLSNHPIEELVNNWSDISGYQPPYGIVWKDDKVKGRSKKNIRSNMKNTKLDNSKLSDNTNAKRIEYITDSEFLDRFYKELIKYGEIKGLKINSTKKEEVKQSYIIPLQLEIPEQYYNSYNEYLHYNMTDIWNQILIDDSMEILNDMIRTLGKDQNPIEVLLTNDCTTVDKSIEVGALGIEVKY